MAQNDVNMSLDEIIQQNRQSGGRGRGRGGRISRGSGTSVRGTRGRGGLRRGGSIRGRTLRGGSLRGGSLRGGSLRGGSLRGGPLRGGSLRGGSLRGGSLRGGSLRGRAPRGGPARGRPSRRDALNDNRAQNGGSRSRSRSRSRTRFQSNKNNPNVQNTRSRSRSRSRLRTPSNVSQQQSRGRSRSRNRFNGQQNNNQTQRGRSRSRSQNRFNGQQAEVRGRGRGRGRGLRQNLLARGISTQTLQNNIISKYSRVGLRSDLIAKAQKHNYVQNKINRARLSGNQNIIQSQTFTRSNSRAKSPAATRLTVSVANDIAMQHQQRRPLNRRRRNSASGNQVGYLDRNSLAALGEGDFIRGPGSARSMNSNASRKSGNSVRSQRGRGRGRGRGNFQVKPVLNARLQMEIAAIQGRSSGQVAPSTPKQTGINFTPTPHLTNTSLNSRFSTM